MPRARFYLRYALRSLRRGGQRSLLAILCIAFGVMSLVSMQLLAATLEQALIVEPRIALGGDVVALAEAGRLAEEDLAALERLKREEAIHSYSPLTIYYQQILRGAGSGSPRFLGRSMAVDPLTFPLVGEVILGEPAGARLAGVLGQPGSIAVTRDLADAQNLRLGQQAVLKHPNNRSPVAVTITGIIDSASDRQGDTVYYSHETARLIVGPRHVAQEAQILLTPGVDGIARLEAAGFNLQTPDMLRDSQPNYIGSFIIGLKGAGLLGLLVGGIGVANTMRLLLARRTLEIAVLKTLGYRQGSLMAIIGLETALMGLLGSLPGALAALAVASWLTALLGRTVSMLVDWSIDPLVVVGSLLAGSATAVFFGLSAGMRSSAVRPAVLLREQPARIPWGVRLQAFGLWALLSLLFWALCSVIMGSPLLGAGVLAVAVIGLVLLGTLLGAALAFVLWLPLPGSRLLRLARNSLRRQRLRAVFALIALFVGVFSIGFALETMSNAGARVDDLIEENDSHNLAVYARPRNEAQALDLLRQVGASSIRLRYASSITLLRQDGRPLEDLSSLEGRARDDLGGVRLDPSPLAADAIYLPEYFSPSFQSSLADRVEVGDTLVAVASDGTQVPLTVAGFWYYQGYEPITGSPQGALVDLEAASALDGAETTLVALARVAPERQNPARDAIKEELSEALVLTQADLDAAVSRTYRSLFFFVMAVASLALVAGAVLIANAVGLAMVERRREVGIFKAVGFTSRHIIRLVLLEYGLLGLLAGVLGMGAVWLAMVLINNSEPNARLSVSLVQAAAIVLFSVLITSGSAALVAWRPSRERPLPVLRGE